MNESIILPQLIEPLAGAINPVLSTLSWLLGGVFGLTLVFLVLRWWQFQRVIILLNDIRYNSEQLNKKYKLKTYREKPSLWKYVKRR